MTPEERIALARADVRACEALVWQGLAECVRADVNLALEQVRQARREEAAVQSAVKIVVLEAQQILSVSA
ncbi:hypothetical protein [Streptomyces sp. MBT27]|uniref:hypothetical protein n=1 Tax=Streptomyces sp. MBT27 TaxID=1488356 RepID=UPI001420110B|nr:hypothetical protein [Streptomyces sp. MBT27]